ncbi:siderophore-interacting protein [Gordonia crocea]|uniref:Putative siderophore-interacting protein n=1 Tax=Gordonia crocea TaxID=589162 RepID=A0A7M3SVF7_9ACTN|nr:siderophore-interacting protein [Gordonia crocea]GED96631.1 putative siderophore-interacting protein [Gordonia crocea]
MITAVAPSPSRGWQGAVLKLLRADDFQLTVTGVDKITDHYLRVHFADGGLLARHDVHPTMWVRLWFEQGDRRYQRAFTLVDPDPPTGTFAVEFAIHDGPAAGWAQSAFVGEEVQATVMGSHFALPDRDPDGWLIAGDASSLAAVNSLLGAIAASDSPDVPVTIWMEYQHDDEFTLPLRAREHHRVEWVHRGETGTAIVEMIAAEAFDATGYQGWVATETKSTRAITALLRTRYRLGRSGVVSQPHWIDGPSIVRSGRI